jgi:hypothetical protein
MQTKLAGFGSKASSLLVVPAWAMLNTIHR